MTGRRAGLAAYVHLSRDRLRYDDARSTCRRLLQLRAHHPNRKGYPTQAIAVVAASRVCSPAHVTAPSPARAPEGPRGATHAGWRSWMVNDDGSRRALSVFSCCSLRSPEITSAPAGVATRCVSFGGAIASRPGSSIEFHWVGNLPLPCMLRRVDSRNYEGASRP